MPSYYKDSLWYAGHGPGIPGPWLLYSVSSLHSIKGTLRQAACRSPPLTLFRAALSAGRSQDDVGVTSGEPRRCNAFRYTASSYGVRCFQQQYRMRIHLNANARTAIACDLPFRRCCW
jgi:hypothetical protein